MRLASANTQSLASYFIFLKRTEDGACLFLETRALPSLQISQEASRVTSDGSQVLALYRGGPPFRYIIDYELLISNQEIYSMFRGL
jgi:hypothetical protein